MRVLVSSVIGIRDFNWCHFVTKLPAICAPGKSASQKQVKLEKPGHKPGIRRGASA
jgi:hypothetical protein